MYIVGDYIIENEIPEEMTDIIDRMPSKTKERALGLASILADSDKFTAYVMPRMGFILFAGDVEEDRKICRVLLHTNGELSLDNRIKKNEAYCSLFDILEEEYYQKFSRKPEYDSDDKEHKSYNKFIPGVLEVLNNMLSNQPEKLN